jgi:hypothetical protein
MHIYNNIELFSVLERAGYKITPPKTNNHYLIYGGYISEPIGCTTSRGRLDVLFEEPRAVFKKIAKKDCPICKDEK